MKFRFIVDAEVSYGGEGKFESRESLAENFIENLSDPGSVEGENGTTYNVESFEVTEEDQSVEINRHRALGLALGVCRALKTGGAAPTNRQLAQLRGALGTLGYRWADPEPEQRTQGERRVDEAPHPLNGGAGVVERRSGIERRVKRDVRVGLPPDLRNGIERRKVTP